MTTRMRTFGLANGKNIIHRLERLYISAPSPSGSPGHRNCHWSLSPLDRPRVMKSNAVKSFAWGNAVAHMHSKSSQSGELVTSRPALVVETDPAAQRQAVSHLASLGYEA